MALRASARIRLVIATAALMLVAGSTAAAAFAMSEDFASGTPRLEFVTDHALLSTADGMAYGPSFENLIPGGSVTSDILVHNTGTAAACLDLVAPVLRNETASSGDLLQDAITVRIVDTKHDVELYHGSLVQASFSDLIIETGEAGRVPLRITATLHEDTSQEVAGQRIAFTLEFRADQA